MAKNFDWYDNDCKDGKCGECGYCTQGEAPGMLQEIGGVMYSDAEVRQWIYEDNLVAKDEPIREW